MASKPSSKKSREEEARISKKDQSLPSKATKEEKKENSLVKWLYPGAEDQNMAETETKAQLNEDDETSMQAQTSPSSTSGGPDSDVASVDEVPDVQEDPNEGVTEDLSNKVSAGATYMTSLFSSAWTKTAKTANDATANSSSFLSSALSKVAPKTEEAENEEKVNGNVKENEEQKEAASMTASSLFTSALGGFGFGGKTAENEETETKKEDDNEEKIEANKDQSYSIGGFSLSALGKAAVDATHSIKEKVSTGNNMLVEFNKEQESFIKTNSGLESGEVGVAPWVGYQGEDELKAKILHLSEDKRNFVRAPPSGVTFEFEYAQVSSTALALLTEDPGLTKMRYSLVPKTVKEDEFWRNYFYRVSLIKQSFELKDLEQLKNEEKKSVTKKVSKKSEEVEDNIGNDDDEFVSESYQASTSDMAEVDESLKNLGVAGGDAAEEWEAELEGELNEFEVVEGKDQAENPEWENQIQEMLDAEDVDSLK